ncbi:MAG: dihydrolipoyl dehydrogenase [Bdellovibrionales bacterium]|nr:dihydrolipoyl dehydrogenase [Bdellovibrionales bacterium]
MSETSFDFVVIGSGPGGYVGAIRGAQLGLKTAIIEKDATFGGTCLNVGCIPSKALLDSSEHYHNTKEAMDSHGVIVKGVELDVSKMIARKSKIVSDLTGGIAYLFKKNKITPFKGVGSISGKNEVTIKGRDGQVTKLQAKHIMIATGSEPNELPFLKYDGKRVISSTEALELPSVPSKMVVIGAGAIGLELGSVWSRLGSEVTIIEYAPKICGPMDGKLSQRLQTILKKQGLNIITNAQVKGADVGKSGCRVSYEDRKSGETHSLDADIVLVAAGRRPFTQGLGLETVGIEKDERGFIKINDHWQTQVPHIFAIGDVVPGPMLAHKAEEEGVAVAEFIVNGYGHVNYNTVPSVIYTWPEFASVGLSEEQCKEQNIAVNIGTFPFTANGRAKALDCTDGQVKVIAEKNSDKVVGVHIVGPRASDLLGEAVVLMEFGGSAEDLARSFHAHPTLTEVIREAALNVDNRARQM